MNKLRLALSFALAWARTLWIPLFAIVLFVSTLALAQTQAGVVLRGDALKRREYQTYSGAGSTGNYVVNTSGASTNSCLGQQGCAQLNDVVQRLPKNIRHNIIIDVDAGTYTDLFFMSGFNSIQLDAGFPTATQAPSITINGSQNWTNVTPTTGSATGTVTSFTAETGTTATTVCDSAATWTVNDFKGAFLTPTSGALNTVTAKRPIISNTATCVLLAGSPGTYAIGNTFAIQTPSTILVGTGTRPIMTISNLNVQTVMNDVEIRNTGTNNWANFTETNVSSYQQTAGFRCTRCRFYNNTATASQIGIEAADVNFQQTVFDSSRTVLIQTTAGGTMAPNIAFVNSYMRGAVNTSQLLSLGASGTINIVGMTFESTAGGSLISAQNSSLAFLSIQQASGQLRFICPAASTGVGLYLGGNGTAPSTRGPIRFTWSNLSTENCGGFLLSGAHVTAGGTVSNPTLLVQNATYGVGAAEGAVVNLSTGGSYTFTSVTNELLLDTQAYTYSTLSGAGQISNARGSAFLE